jgi:alkanesulfonate monooxygenase SsuD/methylene tetrahydromethanopterin reductase-like flavin-dependent oxidoreductase (luciferase family)
VDGGRCVFVIESPVNQADDGLRGQHPLHAAVLPDVAGDGAAASTERITLGTTVTVLSTDEPLRVFQQLATAAAIPGPHRGRGRARVLGDHEPSVRLRRA